MINFDKTEIKQALNIEQIYDLLQDWGGEPQYTDFGILSATICHNAPGEGSKKLYYYANSQLFQCYSNCNSFDIFQLVIKVMENQKHIVFDLNDAVRWIAQKLGISGTLVEADSDEALEDWKYLANYERIQEIKPTSQEVILKEYDDVILSRFNYEVRLAPWLEEGIAQFALDKAIIGYYPGGDQITIPHFDIDNRFIGLRGRSMCQEESEKYGKYRPLKVNNLQYNHPLGYNLYGLNWAKDNIKQIKKAIIVEAEKSVLKYISYFGEENDICVATCGSSLTSYQMQLLLSLGVNEVIIAFDKQYEKTNTDESKKWAKKLSQIHSKYKNETLMSFIWDKEDILRYKEAPLDVEKDKFLYLFKRRIFL